MNRHWCLALGVWATVFHLCTLPSKALADQSSVPIYCSRLLSEMASTLEKFDFCALNNSRPFTVCLKCAAAYERAASLFGNFINGNSDLSKNCSMLIDGGKLSLVSESFLHIQKIWITSGACEGCYEPNSYKVSKDVHNFFVLRNSVQDCLNTFSPAEKNQTCGHCRPQFKNLSEYFNGLLHSETGQGRPVCVDVLDAMNGTRHEWANMCFSRSHRMTPDVLAAISCSFGFTIIFYLIARFAQKPKDIELARVSTFQSIKLEENDPGSEELGESQQEKAAQSNHHNRNFRRQADFDAIPQLSLNYG